jgi:hypothetical protein
MHFAMLQLWAHKLLSTCRKRTTTTVAHEIRANHHISQFSLLVGTLGFESVLEITSLFGQCTMNYRSRHAPANHRAKKFKGNRFFLVLYSVQILHRTAEKKATATSSYAMLYSPSRATKSWGRIPDPSTGHGPTSERRFRQRFASFSMADLRPFQP